jgi:GNAT superfamily N-acetyltransferase
MRICWPWARCIKISSKTVVVELLHSGHKKAAFSCEHESLSRYLHQQARQDVARNVAQCFVLAAEENKVAGYYTLSMASIPAHELPDELRKKLPNYPAYPVVLLGRLARDQNFVGFGIGNLLLIDALARIAQVAESQIAAFAVVVDPIDDRAQRFYARYGFAPLKNTHRMFLPTTTVHKFAAHLNLQPTEIVPPKSAI